MSAEEEVDRFQRATESNMQSYGVELSSETLQQLGTYYELLVRWNSRLHLVAPCSAEEFATRHVLESLILIKHLPQGARVVDIGSGAGLPILPCLIARPDLTAVFIESSQKKTVFLREALKRVGLDARATIIGHRFEETPTPAGDFVTCRALDEFTGKLSSLLRWAPAAGTLLLFGGETLRAALRAEHAAFSELLLPLSDKRFLFVVRKA